MINWADFEKVDIRVGRIIEAKPFPEAHKPAYQLQIDFGPEIGIKKSSAQITQHYSTGDLKDKLIMAVVNFPPKQIGPIISEVLVLGVADEQGHIILLSPDKDAPLGSRMH